MAEFQTIGIIGKQHDPRVGPTLRAVCGQLRARGAEVLVDRTAAAGLKSRDAKLVTMDRLVHDSDLAIVLGGDGTLLSAGRLLAEAGVPVLGINLGRLGFIVDIAPEEMKGALDRVLRGRYTRERRMLLSAQVVRKKGRNPPPFLAINDVVLRNRASVRMVEFETWLGQDGKWEFISQHRADGLIVSTPTGSTAYALSGGGPVLHPGLEALALVPICPHALSDRPLVVGSDRRVRIVLIEAQRVEAMCTADGQHNVKLRPGDSVEIVRSPHALDLIHPVSYRYFNILRKKLNWGRDRAVQRA